MRTPPLTLHGLCGKPYDLQGRVTLKPTGRVTQKPFIPLRTCMSSAINGFPVLIVLLFGERAVRPLHLADGGGAFPLGFGVKLIIKEDLVHRVRLERAGLCWRLGSPVEVS